MARLRRLALARSAGGNHIRAVVRNELKGEQGPVKISVVMKSEALAFHSLSRETIRVVYIFVDCSKPPCGWFHIAVWISVPTRSIWSKSVS